MKQSIVKCCGLCEYITNLANDSERIEPNVMGGCFLDGHIVTTDEKACKKFRKWDQIK